MTAAGSLSTSTFGWLASCSALFGTLTFGTASSATELEATLPHVLFYGPPAGSAAMAGGDWTRANQGAALGDPETLAVAWRRRISGGIGCNLLVDDSGRIVAAGMGSVTELTADGRVAYRQLADSDCVAATLLADGSRVVLSDEGRVSAWSSSGAPRFVVSLTLPLRLLQATLLPLPDGGLFVSLGTRAFDLSSKGELRGHLELEHEVVQSLVIEDHLVMVDTRGAVIEWDGRAAPRNHEGFGVGVAAVAALDASTLVGITGRLAFSLSLYEDEPKPLLAIEKAGLLPLIAVSSDGVPIFLRAEGTLISASADAPVSPAQRIGPVTDGLRDAVLLVSDDGVVAWMAAHVPLQVVAPDGAPRTLSEVLCAQPASLVSAGARRLAVGCRSGQFWLVGPAIGNVDPTPSRTPKPPG